MFVHSIEIRAVVGELVARGLSDGEIGRRLSLPRTTIRDMRRGRPSTRATCHRCWRPTRPVSFTSVQYAYVLGLYLGDGCIARLARTYSLRLSLDAKYPGIVREARAVLEACMPMNRVCLHAAGPRRTTMVLCVYGNHLPCLFPQHGPGKKHERRIELEPWQREHVDAAPWPLIRGLIQSDGCRFVNRTGRYAYPSYEFSQLSPDIRAIFTRACDTVGVEYRTYRRYTRICRRASVELMEHHVGAKS